MLTMAPTFTTIPFKTKHKLNLDLNTDSSIINSTTHRHSNKTTNFIMSAEFTDVSFSLTGRMRKTSY